MPIPKPKRTEDKASFIDRCVSDELMKDEYPNQSQRLAVCYIAWRDGQS